MKISISRDTENAPQLINLHTPLKRIIVGSIERLVETSHWVQHTEQVISGGHDLSKLMLDMETGERGFLITGRAQILQPFLAAQTAWGDRMRDLKTLVSDNPAQVERLEVVDQLQKRWLKDAAAIEIEKRRRVPVANKSLVYMQNTLRRKVGKTILD